MSLRSLFNLSRCIGALLALAVLPACQSVESNERGGFIIPPDLGLNSLMALPRPFESKDKSLPLMQTADGENDVALPPVAGLTSDDARRLSGAIVRIADGYDILVLPELPGRRTYVLEGVASNSGSSIVIKWYLRNGYGELVRVFEVVSDTPAGTPGLDSQAVRRLAQATAENLAATMVDVAGAARVVRGTDPLSAAPTGPPKLHLGPITGAPGNGAEVLPVALRTTLEQDGLPIMESSTGADYTLAADIARERLGDGSELFSITWRVLDGSGLQAGEIRQENRIPEGALDGDWGATAYYIALGARDGLYRMLAEIELRASGGEGTAPLDRRPVIPGSVLRQNGR